jgi:uncharacterized protein with PIN domain
MRPYAVAYTWLPALACAPVTNARCERSAGTCQALVVTFLVRLFEPGRDVQRGKERQALVAWLRARLPDARLREAPGRIFVDSTADAAAQLARLHGIVSYSPCRACRLAELERCLVELARAANAGRGSFCVRVKRVGIHPFTSTTKAAELGRAVCAALPEARVDLDQPDVVLGVEIRDDDCWLFHVVEPGLDRRPQATPPAPEPPRFLVDQMLGRLRMWLRICGLDAAGTHDQADSELVRRATAEQRVLLTRDRALADVPGVCVHYVKATRGLEQLQEVVAAFGLVLRRSQLTSRCTKCNVPVEKIDKMAFVDRVPASVLGRYDHFTVCRVCNRIYWPGEHYVRIVAALDGLLRD